MKPTVEFKIDLRVNHRQQALKRLRRQKYGRIE